MHRLLRISQSLQVNFSCSDQMESDKIAPPKANQTCSSSAQSPASIVYVRRRVELDSAKPTTNKPSTVTESASHKLLNWEERYHNLQMLLNKLDDSDQTDHLQMLWSLSSAELSKHAVELEKHSIQLSLEEAREMQRVAALNVLGRSSVNSLKSTSNDAEQQIANS